MMQVFVWFVVFLSFVGYLVVFARRYRNEQAAKRDRSGPTLRSPSVAAMPSSPPSHPSGSNGPSGSATSPFRAAEPPVMPLMPLEQLDPASPPATGAVTTGPPADGSGAGQGGAATHLVVDLIRGIELPDDLVPRADVIARPGAHDRVVFTTTTAPADTVREQLSGALELIGTGVRWDDGGWQALLTRDGLAGWLRVHPSPSGVIPPGTVEAPTAPSHTVCAEFWTDDIA